MIKAETTLSKDMDLAVYKEKLDELCKRLLSNKIILAWIMKSCMKEYANCGIQEIVLNYIEGTPEVAKAVVHQDEGGGNERDMPERIIGMNTEDSTVIEGKIVYDIRFGAIIPDTDEYIKLIINIEAQDNFYPRYPLIKRGFYYGILKLLDVLFSMDIAVTEKKRILQDEFGIMMTEELESEVWDMCNFSDGIERRGYERGRNEGIVIAIKNLMKTMGLTLSQAMDTLLIPESDREQYAKVLKDK